MDININYSYSEKADDIANCLFLPNEIDISDADCLLKADGRYCMCWFNNNYRKSENYIPGSINTIALDFDDGVTIEEFKEKANGFYYVIGTTKSHRKLKNGVVADRFRVLLPLVEAFTLSAWEYGIMMDEVNRYFNSDPACRDVARQYRGNPDAEVIFNKGDLFDWQPFLDKGIKRLQIRNFYNLKIQQYQKKQVIEDKKPTISFFKAAKKVFDREYYVGNRNNTVARILLWGIDKGINYNQLVETLRTWVQESDDPLPERELDAMFRYHQRRARA